MDENPYQAPREVGYRLARQSAEWSLAQIRVFLFTLVVLVGCLMVAASAVLNWLLER
jgi:hypothetical protein